MEKTIVNIIKIGGKVLGDAQALTAVLENFAKIQGPKILVHGGGPKAGAISEKLGIAAKMVEGRRITDADTLEVVTMVYAGLLNKQLIGQLQALKCNALGLSGADLNVIRCQKRRVEVIDYGFVGDVEQVDASMIQSLLQQKIVPVFNSITHDGQGQLLNTNADTIAAQLAIALTDNYTVRLFLCFEQKGVLENLNQPDDFLHQLTWPNFKRFRQHGTISGGMIPKLQNAFHALQHQVQQVWIGSADGLKNIQQFKGTQVCL